jgi:AFG3 family protein
MHFAPTLLIGGLILYMAKRGGSAMGGGGPGGGIFGVGKSKAKMFNKEDSVGVKFKDVAGMDEAKEVSYENPRHQVKLTCRKSWSLSSSSRSH